MLYALLMKYEPYYFQDVDGTEPVRNYIQKLSVSERAKSSAFIRHLGEYGPQTTRPAADSIGGRTGLYELRPKPHRYLYFYYHRNKIIFLHAFEKDTKKIRQADLNIALERMILVERLGKISKLKFEEEKNQ